MCESLANLDLSSFDTSNVTDMTDMFYSCDSLVDFDFSEFGIEGPVSLGGITSYVIGYAEEDKIYVTESISEEDTIQFNALMYKIATIYAFDQIEGMNIYGKDYAYSIYQKLLSDGDLNYWIEKR